MSDYDFKELQDYNIDDLFFSVTDIYTQWDEGKTSLETANQLLAICCKAFIKFNEEK